MDVAGINKEQCMSQSELVDNQDEVMRFLSCQPLGMYIGGEWRQARAGRTFETLDPGTGDVLAAVAEADAADVDDAVATAAQAFIESGWATLSANERSAYLHRLADLVDIHADSLARLESLDVGKPLAQAHGFDVPNVAQTLRWYADYAVGAESRTPLGVSGHEAYRLRKPWGVAAFILPWNFPLLLVGWNAAPALAAGNCIVIKPAENTPLSTLYFCSLVEQAGIPAGVVNVVTGYGHTAGKALAEHPGIQHMAFTGSPEVGSMIGESCGRNLVPVKLELGGKGAAVVFEDVDVAATAAALVGAVTLNAGQVCCTATRWVIHERIFDDLIDSARQIMTRMKIGYGLETGTDLGPVVSEQQQSRVLGYLERCKQEGGQLLLDGGRAEVSGFERGNYVKPSLLTGDPDNVACREEIFGPVAFAIGFSDEDQAVRVVNRSPYGLANSVWTQDAQRLTRVGEQLVAGNTWLNAHNVFIHGVPYGGVNKSGLGGGVLGAETYWDYLRSQSIVRPTP